MLGVWFASPVLSQTSTTSAELFSLCSLHILLFSYLDVFRCLASSWMAEFQHLFVPTLKDSREVCRAEYPCCSMPWTLIYLPDCNTGLYSQHPMPANSFFLPGRVSEQLNQKPTGHFPYFNFFVLSKPGIHIYNIPANQWKTNSILKIHAERYYRDDWSLLWMHGFLHLQ